LHLILYTFQMFPCARLDILQTWLNEKIAIVVILTLRNSRISPRTCIVQLVWFSLVLCSQKKPSAAFSSCNINLGEKMSWLRIVGECLWMEKYLMLNNGSRRRRWW
jgi:hypothetical protein